jgi:selenocysteine-specific elongation factor
MLLDRDEMRPGEEVCAQLHLEQPTVAAARDRYVIRSYSPIRTIGGGVILDAVPVRHRRHRPQVLDQLNVLRDGSDAEVLTVHLFNAVYAGLQWPELVQRTPLEDDVLRQVIAEITEQDIGVAIDDNPPWLLHRERYNQACAEMRGLVEAFHHDNPLKPAMFTEELRSKFPRMADKVFSAILRDLTTAGELDVSRDKVKLASHAVTLSPERQALADALEHTFQEAAFQPPSVEEALAAQSSKPADARALLQVLVDQNRLVRLKGDVFYHKEALDQIEQRLRAHLEAHREITAGEFRDMLEISRKYAIPLLEHFDSQRITLRTGDKRILRNP